MALCRRKTNQNSLWVDARHLRPHGSHPFDRRLNEILEWAKYDRYREWLRRKYDAPTRGRPSMAPGGLFPLLSGGLPRGQRLRARDRLPDSRTRSFCGSTWG
jgi:hypothetical protein